MSRQVCLLIFLLAASVLQISIGCAHHKETRPENTPNLTVRKNILYWGEQPYAELRYLGTAKLSKSRGETYLFSRDVQHRGLVMYYFSDGALIWIYPEDKRWQEDIDHCCRSQTQGYFGWVFDVEISDDGWQVHYKTPGLMSRSSWVYSVYDRSSKLIDRDWFPK